MTTARLHGNPLPGRPLLVVALEIEAEHLHVHDHPILVTGLGKVNAAVGVAEALARVRPSLVINLGTAGALRGHMEGTHEVTLVKQHDLNNESILALTGVWPGTDIRVQPAPLPGDIVLTTGDDFVSDPVKAAALGLSAHLVDMEGYAVARAAQSFDVPVRVVKTVSDRADTGAVRSWQSTMIQCSEALGLWVAENLG